MRNATWPEQLTAWIEIWIDPTDDRFSHVSDLREQLTIGEVSVHTLDRAIAQLQSFADRTRSEFLERSILFAQFADLLNGITRPSASQVRHWHKGESLLITNNEIYRGKA